MMLKHLQKLILCKCMAIRRLNPSPAKRNRHKFNQIDLQRQQPCDNLRHPPLRGGIGMTFRRLPGHGILVQLLIAAMANWAAARIWYGEGVHGYGFYGSDRTERGNYGDSAGSDTAVGSSAQVAAND